MIEQEKREKDVEKFEAEKKIQEMAQLGTMGCKGKDCIKCQQDHPHEICWPYRRAKMYYQEGYRKEEGTTVFLVIHQPFHSNESERILEVCQTEKAAQHYIDTHIDEYDKQDTYIEEYVPYSEEE